MQAQKQKFASERQRALKRVIVISIIYNNKGNNSIHMYRKFVEI